MNTSLSLKIQSWLLTPLVLFAGEFISPLAQGALLDQGDGTVYAKDVKLYWAKDAGLLRTMSYDHPDLVEKIIKSNGVPWATPTGVKNSLPFLHVENEAYWAAEEFAPDPNKAWSFATVSGAQDGDGKNHMYWIWPVRSD